MKKRLHVYYSGMVQGVGFRFTLVELARAAGIFGWVKNLPDARVEVIAEAEEDELKDFLEKIHGQFASHIRDADVVWLAAADEFSDFNVRY
ncbi:MAG: acylphosphatase [Candidatus Omnitrophota bacterium]